MTDSLVLPQQDAAPPPPGIRLELVGPTRSAADDPRPRAFGHTLRFALAMRGGVSLAVWIGGAVAELDALRRIRLVADPDGGITALVPHAEERLPRGFVPRVTRYAQLLADAGYDRVEFDLLAGASAGGLNAVLYSVAQRSGASLDSLLPTWSTVGGFWNLLHAPSGASVDALMNGDGYFYVEARNAAAAIARAVPAHPDLVASHVTVDLSATTIDGHDASEQDAWEGRAHFRFVGDAGHPDIGNGIPGRDDPDAGPSLERLAYAARSTSSLPGGFEPALIRSPADAPGGAQQTYPQPDMRAAFSAHRATAAEPFRVVDGAVFDNVPIDRALQAARNRSSDSYASRALLFLDPDPDPPIASAEPWDSAVSHFAAAIRGYVVRSTRREASANEVDAVADFNGEMLLDAGHRDALGALVRSAEWSADGCRARRAAYLRALGTTDAVYLAQTLARPSVWQLTSALAERRRWCAIDLDRLSALRTVAVEHFNNLSRREDTPRVALADGSAVPRMLLGPSALSDAANCVIAWTRALERVPLEPGGRRLRDLGSARLPAYAALRAAVESRERATVPVLDAAQPRAASGGVPSPAELADWIAIWIDACSSPAAVAALRDYWDALDGCIATLRAEAAVVDARIDQHTEAVRVRWRESPWAALAASPGPLGALDLASVIAPSGVPPAVSNIRFFSIGVTEQPADAAGFSALATAERRAVLGAELCRRDGAGSGAAEIRARVLVPDGDLVLSPGGKLAGYGFGNFFGFLSAEWRVGDWWWGRLDAASGIVRFLRSAVPAVGSEPLLREPDAAIAELQELILGEAADAPLSPYDTVSPGFDPDAAPAALRGRVRTGSDSVFNLSPAYRVALVSRTVRILDRATRVHGRVVAATAREALLALLRPILVVLPAIADPSRGALLGGLVGGAAWLLTWDEVSGRLGVPIATAATVAIGFTVSLWLALRSGRKRWQRIEQAVEETHPVEADRIGDLRRKSVRDARWAALAAACSFVPLVIALIRFDPLLIILCLGVTTGIVGFAKRLARTVPFEPVAGRRRRTMLRLGVVLLFGTGIPIAQTVLSGIPGRPPGIVPLEAPGRLLVMVLLGIALAALLCHDWLPVPRGRTQWRAVRGVCWPVITVLATIAGIAVGVASWAVTGAFPDYWRDSLAVILYAVAWANVVWWLPELRRQPIVIGDELQRRPL